jgi:hypothetical protein
LLNQKPGDKTISTQAKFYLLQLTAHYGKLLKKLKRLQTQHPPVKRQNGSWARSEEENAVTIARHLSNVFKYNSHETTLKTENKRITAALLNIPTKFFIVKEVRIVIKSLNPK